MSLSITPETKVGALLDAYPQLEETLISAAPAFARLKNPALRKTVAKVATLEQAARVGGIALRELLVKLREAAGHASSELEAESATEGGAPPEWTHDSRFAQELDADRLLEDGGHPLGAVRSWLAQARAADVLRIRSSFRPQPLLDELTRAGVPVFCAEASLGCHETLVRKSAV